MAILTMLCRHKEVCPSLIDQKWTQFSVVDKICDIIGNLIESKGEQRLLSSIATPKDRANDTARINTQT